MFYVIFAETALETMPRELQKHSLAIAEARKRGKKPGEILLDANRHYKTMGALPEKEKRGRPDIAHDLLKASLDSSLNKEGGLRIFLHTRGDFVIGIDKETRLPRSYNSFCGLMEDLWKKKKIEAGGKTLLELREKNLEQLLEEIKSEFVVFDARGKPTTLKELVALFEKNRGKNFGVVIGGFPHGTFSDDSRALEGLPRIALGKTELTAPAILAKVLSCEEIALED